MFFNKHYAASVTPNSTAHVYFYVLSVSELICYTRVKVEEVTKKNHRYKECFSTSIMLLQLLLIQLPMSIFMY